MPIDADALQVIELIRQAGRPPLETLSPEQARVAYAASRAVLQPAPPAVASVRALAASGPRGDIPVRLYRPAGAAADAALPALVYFHGGGWVIGDLDSHDVPCRALANAAGVCVVSVDYRMAPEHKFPAPVEDCAAATRWVLSQAASLGIEAARVAVGGDSAGGNLAAVMALLAREEGWPKLAFQLLIYPATDLHVPRDPLDLRFEGLPLSTRTMWWFVDHYLTTAKDALDWRASPARAAGLGGLPPAFVLTAGYDPLCAEGCAYARRLAHDGVPVAHLHLAGQIHGFLTMSRIIRAADEAIAMMAAALRRAVQ